MNSETRPSQIISRAVEMVDSRRRELDETNKRVEKNFDILPTHIPGRYILADHDAEPDLTRSQTLDLGEVSRIYFITDSVIKALQEKQKTRREKLVYAGENIPGTRGFRDEEEGWEVQINPQTEDIFDEELLDASLEGQPAELVHKKVVVTIELDPDTDDVEGFVKSAKRRLKRQGMPQDKINMRVNVQRQLRVDKEELQKLVEKGEIILLPGAWTKKIASFRLNPRSITTDEELREAVEKADRLLQS